MAEFVGLITARGGSKGVPKKNIKLLAGKPLISWTIEAARQSRSLSRVIVSTDDEEIARVARRCGAEVPFLRPAELARDDTPHIDTVSHAIHCLAGRDGSLCDYTVLLQPTCPFRTAEDIDCAVEMARKSDANAVVSVCKVGEHPYLTKQITERGTLEDFVPPPGGYLARQTFPDVYVLNGAVYVNRCSRLLAEREFVPPDALAYVMPPERSIDIDTAWDLYVADLILRNTHVRKSA